jgi:hypothetical protein
VYPRTKLRKSARHSKQGLPFAATCSRILTILLFTE